MANETQFKATTRIIATRGVREYRETIPAVVGPSDHVLEVGCEWGTTTAVLARYAARPRLPGPRRLRHQSRTRTRPSGHQGIHGPVWTLWLPGLARPDRACPGLCRDRTTRHRGGEERSPQALRTILLALARRHVHLSTASSEPAQAAGVKPTRPPGLFAGLTAQPGHRARHHRHWPSWRRHQ